MTNVLRELVLPRLDAVRKSGSGFMARCPAHDDGKASLSVAAGREQPVVLHCQAGCSPDDVLAKLGLDWPDLSAPREEQGRGEWTPAGPALAVYDYRDEQGQLLFQVLRTFTKDFRQRVPDPAGKNGWTWKLGDTRRVLYRLPEIIQAVADGRMVYICEGERDVHTLVHYGLEATCNPGGAGKWRPEYNEFFAEAVVVIVADRDEPGRAHARAVRDALLPVAASVSIVEAAEGKDATDHVNAGHSLADLVQTYTSEQVAVVELAPDRTAAQPHRHPAPALPPAAGEELWRARRTLEVIHQFARARRTAPWAVLGVVLARIVAVSPPAVVLPPLVGGHGSLNLFVALVGPSGAGKGAAERAAAEVVPVGELLTASVGSGEGLAHLYARRVRNAVERHTDNVLLTVAEVDTLTALGSRRGATLLPELRKAWSGEDLGFSYADPDKRLPIAAHSYRLSMILGVQPTRAGALLEDADGGTPQRLLWLPATDPDAPDVAPPEPFGIEWSPPLWPAGHHRTGRIELKVCDAAVQVVDAARLAGLRGEATGLEAHAPLARLKTAAALALLEGRTEVADEDWELAGVIAAVSSRTRERVAGELQRADDRRNVARGEMEGRRAAVAADALNAAAAQRVARALLRMLGDGAWMSRKDLRGRLASRDRQLFEDAVERLVDAGQIEVDAVSSDALGRDVNGHRYRLAKGAR